MLNRIKIGPKLIGGFIIVAMIAGLIGYIGITNIKQVAHNDKILYENMTVPIAELSHVVENFHRIRVNLRDLVRVNDTARMNEIIKTIQKLREENDKNMASFESQIISGEMRKLFDEFKADFKHFRADADLIIAKALINRDWEAWDIIDGDGYKTAMAVQSSLDKIVELKVSNASTKSQDNEALSAFSTAQMLAIAGAGVVLALILGILLTLSITRPLGQVVQMGEMVSAGVFPEKELETKSRDEVGTTAQAFNKVVTMLKEKGKLLEAIAQGDLSQKVDFASKDDMLAKNFDIMLKNMNQLLGQVNGAVEQVSAGSGQVSSASQSLSQGASEQASSLEEISSSITEIGSQAKQNAENATQANQLAKKAREDADLGNTQMKDLVGAMLRINNSAEEIKKIVKTIDDIAFQINLLALNANVEAARAGKYGKGFAVVAEEVRNLAARSTESVKETTRMVDEATKNIAGGNSLVDSTAKQLADIVGGASKVVDLVEEIATASREQAQGLDQINKGLSQIDQVTQSNTASAEESASASEELAGQAQELKALVSRFKLSDQVQELSAGNGHHDSKSQAAKALRNHTESNLHKNGSANGNGSSNGNGHHHTHLVGAGAHLSPKQVIKLDDKDFGNF